MWKSSGDCCRQRMRLPRLALSIIAGLFLAGGIQQLQAAEMPTANSLSSHDFRNLPGADFEPGKLRLALQVTERSGIARKGVVVTSGVPFPPGFLTDVHKLGVVDARGKPVSSQATVMIRWHKPTYDDSVQWALVSFIADVPANGRSTYYLTDDGRTASPGRGLELTRTRGAITVDTGPATFVVPRQGNALISSASCGKSEVVSGKGLRAVIKSGSWPEQNLKLEDTELGWHDEVVVEESGPVRVVLAIKGPFKPGDKNGKFYDYTARLYFTAGSSSVRVIYTISNGKLDPKLTDGSRHAYVWPIEDASLVAELKLDRSADVVTLAEGKQLRIGAANQAVTVYQDSSGGDKWQKLGGGNYEQWLSRYTEGKSVRGVSFRGYRLTVGEKLVASSNSHSGVIAVGDGSAGVVAALRNFRVEYPSAVAASSRQLRVGLFPGEFSEPFALRAGQRKSWDLTLTLFDKRMPDLQACFAQQDTLLLFRAEPAWMVRCAAWGAWPSGLALVANPKAERPACLDKSKLEGIKVGWDWYGWISSWNAGGGHWNQSTCFASWVLWGDGAGFDVAEARAVWAGDLCSIHYDNPDLASFWLMLRDWNWRENRLKLHVFPDYYNRDTWGRPDSGHMGMFMWPEYYLLTGDRRAREAWEHLGIRARAFLWQYNYDDRADGSGPLPRAIDWCRKRDPDVEADFKLATRYVGWPLYDLAQYYRLTGDLKLLAEARTVARAFRNTARYSPIGFMVLQINARGDGSVYGKQGPFDKGRAESASQCYAHFQEGIMATGLVEYYRMSRDPEALDALIGFSDCVCHHAMLHNPQGKRIGWTYCFGDYWGPYRYQDLPASKRTTWMVSNFRVVQPLSWIYVFTGRRDYHEVLKDAVASLPGPSFLVPAAHMAVQHPKVDDVPPVAITNLKAEALTGGRVRLTWTAPGDDGVGGRASRYEVKYSTASIVELVKGWPDRALPLPTNKEEWEKRAAAFNAKQRAFWAANTVTDALRPSPAGTGETMTIEKLPTGKVHFAIKSWDDEDNISKLSNVVAVMVK